MYSQIRSKFDQTVALEHWQHLDWIWSARVSWLALTLHNQSISQCAKLHNFLADRSMVCCRRPSLAHHTNKPTRWWTFNILLKIDRAERELRRCSRRLKQSWATDLHTPWLRVLWWLNLKQTGQKNVKDRHYLFSTLKSENTIKISVFFCSITDWDSTVRRDKLPSHPKAMGFTISFHDNSLSHRADEASAF